MKPDTQALLDGAASEHGIPDVDAWIDSAVAAIQQQERELEMITEALKIASTVVKSLHLECDRHRQAANEHRNAAMEADLRTQAAVRSEKQALAENGTLKEENKKMEVLYSEEFNRNNDLVVKLNAAKKDAERYQSIRRGQKWSVVNGIGDTLIGDVLDAAIDAAMRKTPNVEVRRGPTTEGEMK